MNSTREPVSPETEKVQYAVTASPGRPCYNWRCLAKPKWRLADYLMLFKKRKPNASPVDLFKGARIGDLERVTSSVAAGISVHTMDETKRTALCVAAKYGRLDIAKFLLDSGADVNSVSVEGKTPIYFAVMSGLIAMVELIKDRGGRLDVIDSLGYTPLTFATELRQIHLLNHLKP